ncbi:MAG: SixA phosphatase family protein [Bacteroidota bacterium]
MKTLYLIRHGKSSWDNLSVEDYERPLLPKGIRRTKKVASFLKENSISPQLIVSSHAVRAFETACIIAEKLKYPLEKIQVEEDMYFSGAEAMENIIYSVDDRHEQLMLVGHNPDMTNFANHFLFEKIDYLPTSGVVAIEFDTTLWNEIMSCPREIKFVITPKTLK